MPDQIVSEWVRICRIEAMRTSHQATKALLLDLAREFEFLAGSEAGSIDPDDPALQNAVAERLAALAWRRNSRPA